MTEQNRQNPGANSSSGEHKNEHSFYALAPQPLMLKDKDEAERQALEIAEAAKKAEEEINKTLVDSVPILVRRSSIDAEVEALKKGPTQHQIRSTNRFGIRVAASRLQEQAARRPSTVQKNAPIVNQSTPAVSPDMASPEELAAESTASAPVRPRKPIISEVNAPLPEAKPLERPLMSSGPSGPRALVTPTKPRALNSITVKKLAVHAAPSSLRIAAPSRSTVLTRLNPMVTRQSPLDGREAILRNNPQPRAVRPIVGKRTASGVVAATISAANPAAAKRPAVVAGKQAPKAANPAAAKRPAVVAGKPVQPSAAKAALAAKRPAVVAGKPVPRDNKAAAGSVVAGKPVPRTAKAPAGAVVAGRPSATPPTSAPSADASKPEGGGAAAAAKPSAKVRNAGHFLKRREAASTLRKRNFAESEPDLSKLPWTEGMLKLAAVPLLSDFFQVDAVMFETLSTYVRLELHTVKDYFSNCYSSENASLELSLLSEQIPVLKEAFAKLPTEEIQVEGGSASDEAKTKDKEDVEEAKEDGDADEDKDVKDKEEAEKIESGEEKTESGEEKKDTEEDGEKAESKKSEDNKTKIKLIISPQPLAINSECCRQFLKAYFPEMKNHIGDLLVEFYVLGGNENAEGRIYENEPLPAVDESEKDAPAEESKPEESKEEAAETKTEEPAEETKPEAAPGDALDSLGMLDGFDLGMSLDGGEIQLNDIKLDDLSFDDLLSGM